MMPAGLERSFVAPPLRVLVDGALDMPEATRAARPFLTDLTGRDRTVRAVLLYGSCLWPSVRGRGSCPDFIVVVDSLREFFGSFGRALLGALLPPSVYHLRNGADDAKLSIITPEQLASSCAAVGKDLHLAGRLSKRVALVWARDEESRALVVDAQLAALRTLAPLALARLGAPVTLDGFIEALLRISYESEVRIVEPAKVAALFSVEREHYRAVARALLAESGARLDESSQRLIVPRHVAAPRTQLARRLASSRRRALLRWPKYLLTYDGWLDYLTNKLARTGSPVVLTSWQRRLPLILALPILYRLATARRLT
jgi:hypothetical protein